MIARWSGFAPVAAWTATLLCLSCSFGQAAELPIRRIVLYTAGVGFFERQGNVQETETVALVFPSAEINDLLKSMVVQDRGGGTVSRITYGSPTPLSHALSSFAVDLADNPTLADLLDQLRGTSVRCTTTNVCEGTIVGLEIRADGPVEQPHETTWLNLLTEQGLQSLELSTLQSVQVLDPDLEQQFRLALAEIAKSRREDLQSVSIELRGTGQRPVSVGYIREFPVWKVSYRLVLAADKPPLLQGWAIVENTTDEDWSDVQLSLVSGRPISFVMELNQPLYVERPRLLPDVYGTVAPRVYDRGRAAPPPDSSPGSRGGMGGMGSMGGGMGGMVGSMGGMGGWMPSGPSSRPMPEPDREQADGRLQIAESVAPDVSTEEVGELFRYDVDLPVSLSRNRSAMFPIVNSSLTGEGVSIYSQQMHPVHPLRGLKLTNNTDLYLMQGPITVFDEGTYAGDSRMRDLAPGDSRLISYALDVDLDVALSSDTSSLSLTKMSIRNGMVQSTHESVRTATYSIETRADTPRQLVIEQPLKEGFVLSTRDALEETTSTTYRFRVPVEPGPPVKFVVREIATTTADVPLASLDEAILRTHLSNEALREPTKRVIEKLLNMRAEQAEKAADLTQQRNALRDLMSAQTRIRENMKPLERTSELYQQYVQTMTDLERQINDLGKQIQDLDAGNLQRERALERLLKEASE